VFSDFVYLAKDKDEYIPIITRALEENTPALQQARIDFAGTHTWENNVKAIYEAINAAKS